MGETMGETMARSTFTGRKRSLGGALAFAAAASIFLTSCSTGAAPVYEHRRGNRNGRSRCGPRSSPPARPLRYGHHAPKRSKPLSSMWSSPLW